MARINDNFLKLQAGYLFPEISKRVGAFTEANPEADVIKLGIGDVVFPLADAITKAFHQGVDEMAEQKSFKGYGPEQGYAFLRDAIAENDYKGLSISPDEIFVSDGSKCDSGNIQEIFDTNCKVAIADPAYPVYVDTNVMAGRTGAADKDGTYSGIEYMPLNQENSFSPSLPETNVDLIYLCSPNNPTGMTMSKDELKQWVDYAKKNDSIILFDAAYEKFISNPDVPRSIFEIDGAKECAIEFRSFSKTAGFTGVRCAFTVVPKELMGKSASGEKISIHQLWNRRHNTKFNGASYPVQKAAAAIYSEEGKKQVAERVAYYMENARIVRESLSSKGIEVFGGVDAPYVWIKTPGGDSWAFFDQLLNDCHLVGTPGAGFGPSGEGYFRLSAFSTRENINEAMKRIDSKLSL